MYWCVKPTKTLMKNERIWIFSLWHDRSALPNYGHLLMMVACSHDAGVFLTDGEYKEECNMEK